jgi:hypothetical protein
VNDADQVTALAVGFMVTLPLLLFAVVRLEDTIADPPMRLRRRLLAFVLQLTRRR